MTIEIVTASFGAHNICVSGPCDENVLYVKRLDEADMCNGVARGSSMAQFGHTTRTLDWIEVAAGSSTPVPNPNGVLEPGEGAMVRLSITFTPIGSTVLYTIPHPPGTAPVAGFRFARFSLFPSAANGGAWSNLATSSGFSGIYGGIWPDGTIDDAMVWQPDPVGSAFPIATNPLPHVWRAVWTPPNYNPRLVGFELGIVGVGLSELFAYLGQDPNGNPIFGLAPASSSVSQIQIPVVPAPGAAVIGFLVFASAGARRRQRR